MSNTSLLTFLLRNGPETSMATSTAPYESHQALLRAASNVGNTDSWWHLQEGEDPAARPQRLVRGIRAFIRAEPELADSVFRDLEPAYLLVLSLSRVLVSSDYESVGPALRLFDQLQLTLLIHESASRGVPEELKSILCRCGQQQQACEHWPHPASIIHEEPSRALPEELQSIPCRCGQQQQTCEHWRQVLDCMPCQPPLLC
ncbi:hypothetical protein GGTG_04785 [Gaeumannomyces tritici R3-111a-1]|uniref:Uncharacterized protein n=1 Tax=Gaeumannomyces tritici (strain R3-111a-1) TaxID=644352 RepID=J3NU34_GAET3|nr:hypothetical protein GGTG_04785 [Gaeumannomyces tritici R3-111a-1]EJT79701.1 hypothetical protein GGTG_04785 [Gaeumannomyces tritici R3-111a-1]